MNFVTSISLVVLGAMFLALLGWGSIRAAWRNCEGRRGLFAALAILAAVCSIVAQKPSPDTPTITVDALLRDVGCYATNNVFHAAVTNAPSYAGVDFSDCDLMVYARERASTNAASWFELTPRKKFSQQPADYAIENATNFNYMVYLNYVPPSPVHTNGVFELHGFVIPGYEPGNLEQLAAGFINSRAVTIRDLPYDAEVEYLASTGTQFINTLCKIVPRTTKFEFAFSAPSYDGNSFLFGARNDTAASEYSCTAYRGGSRLRKDWAMKSEYFSTALSKNKIYTYTAQDVTLSLNDETFVGTGNKSDTRLSYDFLLFTVNTAGSVDSRMFAGRLYSAKLWEGDALIFDGIPVRKGTVGYLYDRVSGQLFGNVGTGAFDVGPDK